MTEKATGLELFHVVKTVVLSSEVTSAVVVQTVSNKVVVNEAKTVLIEQPDTDNKGCSDVSMGKSHSDSEDEVCVCH